MISTVQIGMLFNYHKPKDFYNKAELYWTWKVEKKQKREKSKNGRL